MDFSDKRMFDPNTVNISLQQTLKTVISIENVVNTMSLIGNSILEGLYTKIQDSS